MTATPKVYIVLLNYRNWEDTVECLESIFRLEYANFQVVVVDNASGNESSHCVVEWAKGQRTIEFTPPEQLQQFVQPAIDKPIETEVINATVLSESLPQTDAPLILLQSNKNRGFAGGNNLALKWINGQKDGDYIWVLNNDTVVTPTALSALVNHFESSDNQLGMLGSKLRYYHFPEKLQAVGGQLHLWTASLKQLGDGEIDTGQYDQSTPALDYVIGAAMFISHKTLAKVGLLSEDYFLYFEELDWCTRIKRSGMRLGFEPNSVVYHKQGAITQSSGEQKHLHLRFMFFKFRNTLLFYKKFFPGLMVPAYLKITGRILKGAILHNRHYLRLLLPVLTLSKNNDWQ